jgi:hypothetical protein
VLFGGSYVQQALRVARSLKVGSPDLA